MQNWGGNVAFHPTSIEFPASPDQLCGIIKNASEQQQKIRVIGAGHSFSPLIATNETLIDLEKISGLLEVNKDIKQVKVAAGTRIRELTKLLHQNDLALANQGDIEHQTIAGAISTGTHGTGQNFGSLSSFVVAMEFIDANGEVHKVDINSPDDLLHACQVHLGSLGVITSVTLQTRDKFILRDLRKTVPLEQGYEVFFEYCKSDRHCEFFWFPYSKFMQIKRLQETKDLCPRPKVSKFLADDIVEHYLYRGICEATRLMPRITPHSSSLCGRWIPGSDYSDWSYRVYPSSRHVRFTEMEYAVPLASGLDCFKDIIAMIEKLKINVFFPIEFRVAAADKAWLSPFYQRESAIISLHVYRGIDRERFFREAEAIFKTYRGRPHWGKIHRLSAETISYLYPKYPEFLQLRSQLDPSRTFVNEMLEAYFP